MRVFSVMLNHWVEISTGKHGAFFLQLHLKSSKKISMKWF